MNFSIRNIFISELVKLRKFELILRRSLTGTRIRVPLKQLQTVSFPLLITSLLISF